MHVSLGDCLCNVVLGHGIISKLLVGPKLSHTGLLRRQRLDKAMVSDTKNPETAVLVSPGNHRGYESRAAGIGVRVLKGG